MGKATMFRRVLGSLRANANQESRRSTAILLSFLILLTCIYLFVYSGRIESGDSLLLFDATSSQFRFGDWLLDESAAFLDEHHVGMGLSPYYGERLQPTLAIPLYALAWLVPGIGLVQTTWLFNIIVTLVLVAVFFMLCRQLGYAENTSALASILLGASTILLPYSKTFFREPLAALFLLMVAMAAVNARKWRGWRALVWLISGLIALGLATQTKQSSLLAIPALLCLLAPTWGTRAQFAGAHRFVRALLDAAFFVFILSALASCIFDLADSLEKVLRFFQEQGLPVPRRDWEFFREAMASQLLSPGGSFWGSSPILLLAVPGAYLLWRRGGRRHLWAATLILLSYAVGHAMRGPHWFGGLSWPPRFLLPALPFVMLLTLPALEWLLKHRHRLALVAAGALLAYSLGWQFASVVMRWDNLPLPEQAEGLLEWNGSLFSLAYLRPVLIISALGQRGWDFAWWRTGAHLLPILYILLASASAYILRQLFLRRRPLPRWQLAILPVAALTLTAVSLFSIQWDPVYSAGRDGLWEMLPIFDEVTERDDIVFVTQEYRDFLLNHDTSHNPRYIVLAYQPGESYHPEIAPVVASASPQLALDRYTIHRLNIVFSGVDEFYFLSDAGPFLPWRPRVLERYFAERAFPIREINTAPDVRLLEYARAPLPAVYQDAEIPHQVRFGDGFQLVGITLPSGAEFSPGEAIPLAMQWQAQSPIPQDLTITWKLASVGRARLGVTDWQPSAGLDPTSAWEVGIPRWDLRALRLPADFPAGEYELWLIVYYHVNGELQHLTANGGETREGYIAVLPITIRVLPAAQ